jgi:hypothetical protein
VLCLLRVTPKEGERPPHGSIPKSISKLSALAG